ncbi:MAG: sulfide/dihydroorotate dehydrogenase-like FAD/NAD-binding protein [Candidatus Anammoximicrobium sp.]|nr:sulfide/dihydroorotate dehydrogenase-like FAD/NAD-binding protein [Candidatus Anammoximicrobium sp.]
MSQILRKTLLGPKIYELVVATPRIAKKARPGQFLVVMADDSGERIPLTIADFDLQEGSVTMVLAVVGTSSLKLSRMAEGDSLHAVIGPLGTASELDYPGTVVMIAGGVGAAPIYPIARAFYRAGNRVVTIQGSRSRELLFWTDRLAAVSDQHLITTDDGSAGRRGLVTEPLVELLRGDADKSISCVYAIGPAVMMKSCAAATQPFGVKTIVSLNTIMVDGTGMCGGCRVDVGGQTRFTCVDGPEFDGHLVNWQLLTARQKTYVQHESCSLNRYLQLAVVQ